jgi:hypothetical protein
MITVVVFSTGKTMVQKFISCLIMIYRVFTMLLAHFLTLFLLTQFLVLIFYVFLYDSNYFLKNIFYLKYLKKLFLILTIHQNNTKILKN